MMNAPSILALSAGLAMDATAVSAARGFAVDQLRVRHVVRVALFFGGFQALMPLLGWFLGDAFGPLVAAWDHWIAFGLLSAIGGKMLWDARSAQGAESAAATTGDDLFGTRVLLLLAIATSIDALAVGVTLPMLGAPMAFSLVSIGLVTAALSALGVVAGRRLGGALGPRLDAFGGLVLLALGAKILMEHLGVL